jgi:hypothetical protein
MDVAPCPVGINPTLAELGSGNLTEIEMPTDPNDTAKNEGEGNRTAARAYNDEQKRFAQSGKVDQAAQDAAAAVDGPERTELRNADELGKRHARAEDPVVKRP